MYISDYDADLISSNLLIRYFVSAAALFVSGVRTVMDVVSLRDPFKQAFFLTEHLSKVTILPLGIVAQSQWERVKKRLFVNSWITILH